MAHRRTAMSKPILATKIATSSAQLLACGSAGYQLVYL
jgi:hypothetical protein